MNAAIGDMLREAALLMVVGMGVVFLFLVLLIAVMQINARLFAPSIQNTQHAAMPAINSGVNDEKLVAVISAAVHQYRKDISND
ncbi:OadG family protein [Neptunicella marina]|uniref:Probable oxaloacetate decarboxylase gamma chain n=1 Tax=Neptunicella marina TaxID=2125989 RepID=A0A8J6ISJ1_9ALTE|nr:OadG family transporter subunit [Neptunicella marina]MBC3765062.1 OadG family protein [Neptunicella marina]